MSGFRDPEHVQHALQNVTYFADDGLATAIFLADQPLLSDPARRAQFKSDLRELVSRSIFMCQNAEYQLKARLLGEVTTLTSGETRLASVLNALPNVTNRTWEYWTQRLDRAGGLPPAARPARARRRAASAKGGAAPKKAGRKSASKRRR